MPTYKSFTCKHCGLHYQKQLKNIKHKSRNTFCSRGCKDAFYNKMCQVNCLECSKSFNKQKHRVSLKNFCSRSCSVTFHNKNKKFGTKRSKLECWIEEQLKIKYPHLEIHFNRSDAINSELDIYIPSLKLAFELNGIFHYEPIFGEQKLSQIQNNDQRKLQACIEQDISFCIIDTSQQKYFKEKTSQQFLNIILNIVEKKSAS